MSKLIVTVHCVYTGCTNGSDDVVERVIGRTKRNSPPVSFSNHSIIIVTNSQYLATSIGFMLGIATSSYRLCLVG